MKRLIYLIIIILALYACKNNTIDPLSVDNKNLPISEKIKLAINQEYVDSVGIHSENISFLTQLYSTKNFKPLWINDSCLTKQGKIILKILENPLKFGIPSNRYNLFKWENSNFIQKELLITNSLAYLSEDLIKGILQKDSLIVRNLSFPDISTFDSLINFKTSNKNNIEKKIIQWGPKDTNYQKLAFTLYSFCNSKIIDSSTFSIPTYKNDSIQAFLKMKEALISKGYINEIENDSIIILEALKKFQSQNGIDPDGKIGKYTCKALNESTYHKVLRTIITLEKWRNQQDYSSNHIRINIPEYMLYLNLDSTKQTHRIIVGKPETKTPELESIINRFVLFPYWTVPQSIKNKEILNEAQKNVSYFARNNFKVFKNEVEIDPTTINWSRYKNSFPFKVRQEFGPKNSLGIIKFEFNNPFGVYVHDTPSKSLFSRDIRSFSHGCMRCQNPIELAKTIIKYDYRNNKRNTIDSNKIDSLITIGKNHTIHLYTPLKIFVEYKSVIIKNNKLLFLIDIYDKDERSIRLII